jgi:DNA-binding response OmpR family regulator
MTERAAEFILLVNDIPDHMHRYEAALRARGYGVTLVESGGDALSVARGMRPDCIVIDERFADMHGWDLCRDLKADPLLARVPVVMLAQQVTVETALHGQHVGCDSWLARPNGADDLVRAIEEVLAKGVAVPASREEALLGATSCTACDSPRTRAGVRVGPAQYFRCDDCGLRWRVEASGEATA